MVHDCLYEEQIHGQSRAIERLDAALSYKKEKLNDLKDDNRRMEEKLDDIQECLNKIVLKSTTDDEQLNNRLIAIETEQRVIKETADRNRADSNLKIAAVTVVFCILTFFFNFVR